MRLNDPLVTSIFFNEKEYPIDLSFDNVLDVIEVLGEEHLLIKDKIQTIVFLLIGEVDLELINQLELWQEVRDKYILTSSEEKAEVDELGNPMPVRQQSKYIDVVHDAKYIYASFRQIGINLFEEQGKLSWEEFQALLESLPDNTIMQRIVQIRQWKPSKGESSSDKKRMRELQKKYAIPGVEREEDFDV